MALTATEIGSIVQELAPALTEGWIQKITQPLPDVLLLEIRVPGHTHRLLCSVHDETARLHLIRQALSNPPTPPSFCQLLRARVQGARIDGIRQIADDRIVRVDLTSRDGPVSLVAELFGRNADLLFLDGTQRVVATLRHNKERSGQPYQTPSRIPSRSLSHDPVTSDPEAASDASPSPSPPNWKYCTVSEKLSSLTRHSSGHENRCCEKPSRSTFAAGRDSAAILNRPQNTNPMHAMANC